METVENDFIKFWFENGLLYSQYKKPVKIDLENAKEVVGLRHEISKNENQYWCYDLNLLQSITSEARDYLTKDGQDYLSASGVVVTYYITKYLFNAYLVINKPMVETKAFRNLEEAEQWLEVCKNGGY
ncbi:MAG: hypothetical protein HRT71_10005 [Flavobacteriales bacterium]|nr:hypothetical protein [Flavobacteriales bacterium]